MWKISQHSIVQLVIWNEMDSDANIAAHLSIWPKVNSQKNLNGFAEYFLPVFGRSRLTC